MSVVTGEVLVVDDDTSFLSAVVRLIRVGGYVVHGVETIAQLRARFPLPPDTCILSDIVLQDESGLSIPGILNSAGETAPIVFMSATDDVEQLADATREGAVRCLEKPFEADDLFAAIAAALTQAEKTEPTSADQTHDLPQTTEGDHER